MEDFERLLETTNLIKMIKKLPRFFNAKVIEILDKLSASLIYFSIGLSISLDGLFDEAISTESMYVILKDSKYFKAWHREVEDTLDDLNEKLKEFLDKLASLAYKESNNSDIVKEFLGSIINPEFYNVLSGFLKDKESGRSNLSKGLVQLADVLQTDNGDKFGTDNQRESFIGIAGQHRSFDQSGLTPIDLEMDRVSLKSIFCLNSQKNCVFALFKK